MKHEVKEINMRIYIDFIKLVKFINRVRQRKVFDKNNKFSFLDVADAYASIKSSNEDLKLVMNRTYEGTSKLLSCLISRYKLTKSETILNQILEVIKEEIIKREA
jgi:hypothetical protein